MHGNLHEARIGYLRSTSDIDNACWHLITLLWRLDLIPYCQDAMDNDPDSYAYFHQKNLVSMWYQLYMELKGS